MDFCPIKNKLFSFTDFPGILSNNCPEIFLICSGDHDISVPWVATYAWIKALGVAVFDEWRPWYLDGQIAGSALLGFALLLEQ